MKKLYSILLFLALTLCFSINTYGQEQEPQEGQTEIPSELRQLYAQSAVLMDADSGRVLFEKNGYEQRPMASTTKIMTLIVTLENANLDEIVTVSQYAAGEIFSTPLCWNPTTILPWPLRSMWEALWRALPK